MKENEFEEEQKKKQQQGAFPIMEDDGGGEHEQDAQVEEDQMKAMLEFQKETWAFLKDMHIGKIGNSQIKTHKRQKTDAYFYALDQELKIRKALGEDISGNEESKLLEEYEENKKPGPNFHPLPFPMKDQKNSGMEELNLSTIQKTENEEDESMIRDDIEKLDFGEENGNETIQTAGGKKEAGGGTTETEETTDPLADPETDFYVSEDHVCPFDMEDYAVETTTRMDMRFNQDQVSRLYSYLDGKNNWLRGSSPNYRELMAELDKLKALSKELVDERADLGKIKDEKTVSELEKKQRLTMLRYLKQAEAVEKSAQKYLMEKKDNINSPYAQSRYDAVTDVRRAIMVNRSTMYETFRKADIARVERVYNRREADKYYKQQCKKMTDWKKNVYQKYAMDISQTKNRKTYFGDRFTNESLERMNSIFSMKRTAAISLTNYALMAEQKYGISLYGIDEILDPSKLQKKKQEMFNTVIEKMTSKDPKDREWIANIMYEGAKKATEHMGDLMKRVDFNDPDYIYSENFTKACNLANQMFDVWQEEARIPKEMFDVISKKDPSIKSFDEYHRKNGMVRGYLDQFMNNINRLAENIPKLGKSEEPDAEALVALNAFCVSRMKKMLADKAKECMSKPFGEWFPYEDGAVGRGLYTYGSGLFMNTQYPGKEAFRRNLRSFIDGSAFDKITHSYEPNADGKGNDKFTVTGEIDVKDMKEYANYTALSDYEFFRRVNAQMDYFDALKRSSGPVMQEYLQNAIAGVAQLSKFSTDPKHMTDEQKEAAKECIQDIFSCYTAMALTKMGIAEQDLAAEVDKTVPQIADYKRYVENMEKGSMMALAITDMTDQAAKSDAVMMAKGRVAKQKLENGEYKTIDQMRTAFAHAYAYALMTENGKLTINPDVPDGRYKLSEFVDKAITGEIGLIDEDGLKTMKKNPAVAKTILNNRQSLRDQLVQDEEKHKRIREEIRQEAAQERKEKRKNSVKKKETIGTNQTEDKKDPKKEEELKKKSQGGKGMGGSKK